VPQRVLFRLSGWDTPLWANPNRAAYRYNRAGQAPTQYLAAHPLGPFAQYLRAQDRRGPERLAELRARLWALRLPEGLDELRIGFDEARDHGILEGDLVSDEYGACQDLADQLRADSAAPRILVVPSAALPGTENVVILGPRVAVPWDVEPVDDSEISCSILAEQAQPPAGLLALVRFRGDLHAGFEAWTTGETLPPLDLQVRHDAA
jgi:hypothetical protein